MTESIVHSRSPAGGWAAIVSMTVLLSACAMTPQPFTQAEFAAKGQADRTAMFAHSEPLTRPLTLADAVARVLRDNLDARAKMMEEAVSMGQLDLDRFDLLPSLVAEGGYVGRSDHATVTSRNAVTLEPALSDPYYSTDRDRKVGDLTMSWNVLDFGVSWYTAHQNADRALIVTERRRKAVAGLTQEVRFAFWRAAAAQRLNESVNRTIATADSALGDAQEVEAEQLRNPVDALRYRKGLLANLSQLETIQQELATAKAELAALINLPPGQDYTVAVPAEANMAVPPWHLPVDDMEAAAFINNPDLREEVYQTRVSADETRKAFLKILPGLNLSAGRQADSNTFLVDNYWNQASAQISWNLLNIVSAPDRIHFARTNEKLTEARRLALRMAILAQVHVSRSQYDSAVQQYRRADQAYDVERKLADIMGKRQESDAQSVLDRVSSETSAITAELRRYQLFAQAQSALGRMQATMGIDIVPSEVTSESLESLSAAIEIRLAALDHGEVATNPTVAKQ
jgi:outer membrane protein TolC